MNPVGLLIMAIGIVIIIIGIKGTQHKTLSALTNKAPAS